MSSEDPEDLISITQQQNQSDDDEEDQIDWIALSKGIKDYEPDNTFIQSNQLQFSLNVMYDIISQPITVMSKSALKVTYDESKGCGVVYKPKGSFMNSVGLVNSHNQLILSHIEMLYLVSRGTIQPVQQFKILEDQDDVGRLDGEVDENALEEREIGLDIMNLYTNFQNEQDIEKYWIYAYLKRLGFIVMAFKPQTMPKISEVELQYKDLIVNYGQSIYHQVKTYFQPLTTYASIFQSIKLNIKPIKKFSPLSDTEYFDLNVWKPSTKYNKKSPPLADYKVKIFDFEEKLKIDNIYVDGLPDEQNRDKKGEDKGYLLAVIQHGITNYISLKRVDLSQGPL